MVLPHDLCSMIQNASRARHARVAVPHTTQNLGILTVLLRSGLIQSLTRGTSQAPLPSAFTSASEPERRIWAELKYRAERPVLNEMHAVSKPSLRKVLSFDEIRRICSGRRAQTVRPLGMGEVAVVHTKNKEHEGHLQGVMSVTLALDRHFATIPCYSFMFCTRHRSPPSLLIDPA
ncbi:unnamed protein product [Peniophora sp. CBMAI 1063]|nr:unnamed protein product [Peniophora sp. CBMAI 1063]